MLKGISKYMSPELLSVLCRMGHGDEIILADAHFPGHSLGPQVIRADGITIAQLLEGIMPLFELDTYAAPLAMMDYVKGDQPDPSVERDYMQVIREYAPTVPNPERIERHAFYERARNGFAIVMTGEVRKYGNLILKKGVTPVS
jgi:L-fucose mutarotase